MKILVVSNLLTNRAEPERAAFNWAQVRALAKLADVVAVAPVPWVPPLPVASWRERRSVPEHERIDGIDVYHPRYLVVPKTARPVHG